MEAAWSGPGEDSLPSCWLPTSHCVLTRWKQLASFHSLFYKVTNPILQGSALVTSQRVHLLIPSSWGLGFLTWILREHKHSDHSWLSTILVQFSRKSSHIWDLPSIKFPFFFYSLSPLYKSVPCLLHSSISTPHLLKLFCSYFFSDGAWWAVNNQCSNNWWFWNK